MRQPDSCIDKWHYQRHNENDLVLQIQKPLHQNNARRLGNDALCEWEITSTFGYYKNITDIRPGALRHFWLRIQLGWIDSKYGYIDRINIIVCWYNCREKKYSQWINDGITCWQRDKSTNCNNKYESDQQGRCSQHIIYGMWRKKCITFITAV